MLSRSPPQARALLLCITALAAPARFTAQEALLAQDPEPGSLDLSGLSLEELMNVEVSVASRHAEPLLDAYAAVYVISGDEIRRSGPTSLQEILRRVPGFHVAQWSTSGWDVTSRGFTGSLSSLNQSFANQLLLMVDGVTLYSPVMAGIWWPLVDVPLDDIERIEILRGPAGTLWGANAMNGVVNVITKHASETLGTQASASISRRESSQDLRHGFALGEQGWMRAWISNTRYEALPNAAGVQLPEDWWIASAGTRADWDLGELGRTRLNTSFYTSQFGEEPVDTSILGLPPFDDTPKNGGRILGSWEQGEGLETQRLQAWYTIDHQKQVNFEHDLQVLDLEYTRRHQLGEYNALVWGVGYRLVQTNLASPHGFVDFVPEYRRTQSGRGFVQNETQVPALNSKFGLGVQIEESSLGGFQVQPNARWLWRIDETTSLWASISRAVRTPSIEEVDIAQYLDPNAAPDFVGNEDFKSEELLSHELGLRTQVGSSLFLDGTLFYNDYESLQSTELDPNSSALTYGNQLNATAFGAELAADYTPTPAWRLRSAYTFFEMDFEAKPGSFEAPFADVKDGLVPRNHANLRSYWDVSEDWELDAALYWTDELPAFANDAYWRLDLRVGWQPSEHLEWFLGGQNLTETEHTEAGDGILGYGAQIERLVYLGLRLTY